ncbi:hypothetical protein HYV86_01635 [Candidatus Woesearchaeota archaeon]|nr:hypothetical protein [Candidatus Woesearchaeota archaeon]
MVKIQNVNGRSIAKSITKEVPVGTIRVKASTLKPYEKTNTGWKISSKQFPELLQVVKLFKAHNHLSDLIDTKNSEFLKGQLSSNGQEQGARINVLPTGEKLEKAFSLFSPHLTIHDQDSHDHWDVLYQNKGGTWSYVYTLAKRQQHRSGKYKKVDLFSKYYSLLLTNVTKSLTNKKDPMALPMYTLLKTNMRVGNEIYFKAHGHKGLTTLTKKDLLIKGNVVTFHFLAKDGVPVTLTHEFPPQYVGRLKASLATKKTEDFIFDKEGKLLHETDFKKAFISYCGHEFYPHIVRSYYATNQVKTFLATHKRTTKEQIKQLYLSIAHALGHMKFDKKNDQWQDNFTVTIHSYIQPELVQKLESLAKE